MSEGSAAAKVYDYDRNAVSGALLERFRANGGAVADLTVADLVAATGLPSYQVETEIKAVSDEYGARLKVTESGEILYSFPDGLRSRYRGFVPAARRFLRGAKVFLKKAGAFLFKAWIAVTLVGYFALFVAILVLALVASAAAGGKNSRSSKASGNLVGALVRLFLRIWIYGDMFKKRENPDRPPTVKKPMHKTVFSFVFGEGDPNADWETVERRAVLSFLRANRGAMTLEEFMAITGLSPREAESRINRYMLEFEGTPEASEGGIVWYRFPKVMLAAQKGGEFSAPERKEWKFSANERSVNTILCVVNGFNLVMGLYFAIAGLASSSTAVSRNSLFGFVVNLLVRGRVTDDPVALLTVALGVVPVAFSVLFWLIPAVRLMLLKRENRRVREANERMLAYRSVLRDPSRVEAGRADDADPGAAARRKAIEELAAFEGAEVASAEPLAWDFSAVARAKSEIEAIRARIDPETFELGDTVFDSHA